MTNYRIVITAVDRATATAKKINESMSRITAPFREIGNSVKNLGREVGVEKIGKDLRNIGSHAAGAARKLGTMVPAMAAVTGVASVAGVLELAKAWAQVGRNVTYASQNIGISASRLQAWQGAAKLAGLSGEGMAGSLQSLGRTMEDAMYGRNQQALMLFNRLGIGLKRGADGQWDVGGEMSAIADAIAKRKNPQQQQLIADTLGVGQMLPFLRKGSKGIAEYERTAQGLGAVLSDQDVQRADQFAFSLSKLSLAGEGLKNSIGSALIPAIQPLVGELTDWISKNRELIATDIAGYARDFGAWVKSVDWKQVGQDVTDFIKGIGTVVKLLGGWKNAAIAVAVAMNASLIGSVLSLTAQLARGGFAILTYVGQLGAAQAAATGLAGSLAAVGRAGLYGAAAAGGIYIGNKISDAMDGTTFGDKFSHYNTKYLGAALSALGFKDNRFAVAAANDGYDQKYNGASSTTVDADLSKRVMAYFVSQGWTPNQAAGLAANFGRESGLNPSKFGDHGGAYGIGQWHKDRQDAFARWAGRSIIGSSLEDQLRFANYELTQGSERHAGDLLRGTTTAAQAGAITSQFYERPADTAGEAAARAAIANQLAAPTGPYSGGAKGADGTVHVQIDMPNAPAGTKAKTTTNGNTSASVRIGSSMVGAMA